MVDQNPPHRFGRGGEEVAAAVEVLVADQPQVRLVDQGGGVEGVPGVLRGHPRGRELPQLVVDERQQRSAAWRSPCSMAERMRVTSFIALSPGAIHPRIAIWGQAASLT